MKVIILKSSLNSTGGLEKYTLRLAHAFARSGCVVTILTSGTVPKLLSKDIAVYSVSSKKRTSYGNITSFDKGCIKWLIANTRKWDIIFGMERNSYQTHYRAGNGVHASYLRTRRRISSFFKGLSFSLNPLHYQILKLERTTYENPSLQRLFTNSCMVKDEILNHYTVDQDKISVIHNGVEWNEMQQDFSRWTSDWQRIRHSLGLSISAFQWLFIGNDFQRKGLDCILSALAQLPSHDFQLSVVGKDKNLPKYQKMVRDLGLTGIVKFFGPQKKIIDFYKTADSLLIPSLYDPFANVTIEALAMGLFVLSSMRNGAHEILTKDSGIIVDDVYNVDAMVAGLKVTMKHRKTRTSSHFLRESVKHLDFAKQLTKIVLETIQL